MPVSFNSRPNMDIDDIHVDIDIDIDKAIKN